MIHIAWPWMLLLLPLPWLIARWLPPAAPQGGAIFLPFAAAVTVDGAPATKVTSLGKRLLLLLIWLLLVFAGIRPQWLGEPEAQPTTGRHLMLAVDTSGSMQTQDMAGGHSRLQVVQKVAGDFIKRRQGDQVGLILFGTRPYLQAPLTPDLDTVGQFLDEAMIGMAGEQTAIGDAIGLGIKRLQADDSSTNHSGSSTNKAPANPIDVKSNAKNKMVMVLLTDGGNNAGMMQPLAAAKIAADAGLHIYTIGVGAAVAQGFFGTSGNTDLDEDTLKSIAQITGGHYFRATDAKDLNKVYAEIDKLEPSAGHPQWYRPRTEWFPWPLGLALLLSLPAVILREKA
jgi:Ca-activated chloride channel family protein